jgi:hypothetical protein
MSSEWKKNWGSWLLFGLGYLILPAPATYRIRDGVLRVVGVACIWAAAKLEEE